MKVTITGEFNMEIEVDDAAAPANIIDRRTDDFPYTHHDGTPLSPGELIKHLAWNAVSNGVTDLSVLDGYGDFPSGAATMRVTEVFVDNWVAASTTGSDQ